MIHPFRLSTGAWALYLVLASACATVAYPGSVNLIPCTDMAGAGNLRIAYESDGTRHPFGGESTQYVYTEFGIGDRCEVGVDLCDTSGTTDKQYNAKYLLCPERNGLPAVAVGMWPVGKLTKPSYYTVGCKSLGTLRLHVGAMSYGGSYCALAGFDRKITESLSVLADYQSGPAAYSSFGLYWQVSSAIGIDAYYARNNTPELRSDGDYVALNVAYTFSLK